MGMDAEIIAIGPFRIFKEAAVLDYPDDFYIGAKPDDQIITTVARAETTQQSQDLARIARVNSWSLWSHRIVRILPWPEVLSLDPIGGDPPQEIAEMLRALLKVPNVQLWFRPNG